MLNTMKKPILATLLIFGAFVCSALAQGPVRTSKTITLPANPASQNGAMIPDFVVNSLDGKTFDTKALRGKVIVLNLWFINCPFCVQEIAMLNPIVDKYVGKDVVFIGLSINSKPQLDSFLKTRPFKYSNVANAGQLMLMKFGEPDKTGNIDLKFPLHVVYDREGKQVLRKQGIEGVDLVRQELEKQFK